jgi:hypothetical protein
MSTTPPANGEKRYTREDFLAAGEKTEEMVKSAKDQINFPTIISQLVREAAEFADLKKSPDGNANLKQELEAALGLNKTLEAENKTLKAAPSQTVSNKGDGDFMRLPGWGWAVAAICMFLLFIAAAFRPSSPVDHDQLAQKIVDRKGVNIELDPKLFATATAPLVIEGIKQPGLIPPPNGLKQEDLNGAVREAFRGQIPVDIATGVELKALTTKLDDLSRLAVEKLSAPVVAPVEDPASVQAKQFEMAVRQVGMEFSFPSETDPTKVFVYNITVGPDNTPEGKFLREEKK